MSETTVCDQLSNVTSHPYFWPVLAVLVAAAAYFYWRRQSTQQYGGNRSQHPPALTQGHVTGQVQSGDTQLLPEGSSGPSDPKRVVVLFWANWCGHCKTLKPVWDQLSQKYQGHPHIALDQVDCAADESAAEQFKIEGFPTILLFESDGEPKRYNGDRSPKDLERFINQA